MATAMMMMFCNPKHRHPPQAAAVSSSSFSSSSSSINDDNDWARRLVQMVLSPLTTNVNRRHPYEEVLPSSSSASSSSSLLLFSSASTTNVAERNVDRGLFMVVDDEQEKANTTTMTTSSSLLLAPSLVLLEPLQQKQQQQEEEEEENVVAVVEQENIKVSNGNNGGTVVFVDHPPPPEQPLPTTACAFTTLCQRMDQNDPELTTVDTSSLSQNQKQQQLLSSSSSPQDLNDTRAIQLGKALIGNTVVVDLRIRIGSDMTLVGARALVGGMLGSNIRSLALSRNDDDDGNPTLPLDMAPLYLLPMDTSMTKLEELILAFPLQDGHASALGKALTGNRSLHTLFINVEGITFHGAQALSNGICRSQIHFLQFMVRRRGKTTDSATATTKASVTAAPVVAYDALQKLCLQGVQGCQSIQILSLYRVAMNNNMQDLATVIPRLRGLRVEDVHELTISQTQLISHALKQAWKLTSLSLVGCGLGDEHVRALASGLANSASMEKLELRRNQIGDAGVALLVKYWKPDSNIRHVDLSHNPNMGPKGAQIFMRAVLNHARMRVLTLSHNTGIGYPGVLYVAQELLVMANGNQQHQHHQLLELNIAHTAKWTDYQDGTCEAAITQYTQCYQASRALLEGIRFNVYLQRLDVQGIYLLPNTTSVVDEMNVYLTANQSGRCHVLLAKQQQQQQQHYYRTFPAAVWCHFLAKFQSKPNLLFLYLREHSTMLLPTSMT